MLLQHLHFLHPCRSEVVEMQAGVRSVRHRHSQHPCRSEHFVPSLSRGTSVGRRRALKEKIVSTSSTRAAASFATHRAATLSTSDGNNTGHNSPNRARASGHSASGRRSSRSESGSRTLLFRSSASDSLTQALCWADAGANLAGRVAAVAFIQSERDLVH